MREGLQWKARNEGWVVRGGEDLERKARPAGARPFQTACKNQVSGSGTEHNHD
jgi:hypothetical protein